MPAVFQITQWVNHDAKRSIVTFSTWVNFSTASNNSPTSAGEWWTVMSPSMWCINAFRVSSGTPVNRNRLAKVWRRLCGPDSTWSPTGNPALRQAFFHAELCIRLTGWPRKPKTCELIFPRLLSTTLCAMLLRTNIQVVSFLVNSPGTRKIDESISLMNLINTQMTYPRIEIGKTCRVTI